VIYREVFALISNTSIEVELMFEVERVIRECIGDRDIEVCNSKLENLALHECRKIVVEKGPSYLYGLYRNRVTEDVLMKKEDTSMPLLIAILREKIEALQPSDSLIVVDGYIFPGSVSEDYPQICQEVFSTIVRQVGEIRFVTKRGYNISLYSEIRNLLTDLNPEVSIEIRTTEDFHDRFWIVDRSRGIFVGTSLNGIGNKYALIDNLRDVDTRQIIELLEGYDLI
jgi:hypothetical protein